MKGEWKGKMLAALEWSQWKPIISEVDWGIKIHVLFFSPYYFTYKRNSSS